MTGSFHIRPFQREDVPALLALMRDLAVFEGYIDGFRVTEADLIEHGLGPSPRFGAFVAEQNGRLVGMAVHYTIPWTYDLRPTLVLKELFVAETARGLGVGQALMRALAREAERIGAPRLIWTVLPDNEPARHFYAALGAQPDRAWEPWSLNADAIRKLSRVES